MFTPEQLVPRALCDAAHPGVAFTALTALGHAVHLYLQRIAENADLARETAQALVTVADHRAASVEQLAMSETASV